MIRKEERADGFYRDKNLKKYFNTPKGMLHAVDDVNISIEKKAKLWAWWGNPAAENPPWEE